jgi:hypothetical protein
VLQELLQATEKGHADFDQLTAVVAKIGALNDDLSKKTSESKHIAITGLTRTQSKALLKK